MIQEFSNYKYFLDFKKYQVYYAILFIFFIFLLSQGYDLQSDSGGYISASPARGLLYPLFLRILRSIIKSLNFVVFVQLILGFICFVNFASLLNFINKKYFSNLIQVLFLLVLCMPYIGYCKIGNTILTEPLAFIVFSQLMISFTIFRFNKKIKYFYISLLCACCLVLIRKQFIFIFAIFYIFEILSFARYKKINIKKVFLPILTLFISLFIEKSYIYIKTGKFDSTASGVFLIATPLAIAKPGDEIYMHTEQERQFCKKAIDLRDDMKLSFNDENYFDFSWPGFKKYEVTHDVLRFKITNEALKEINIKDSNNLLISVAKQLILQNKITFLKLWCKNVITACGGYYNIFLYLACFCFVLIVYFYNQTNRLMFFAVLVFSFHFLNTSFVAIFLPVLRRYSFYGDALVIILMLNLLINYFKVFLREYIFLK